MKTKEEFCIMPPSKFYSTKRYPGLERHECLEGRTGNRNKSIEDGLVIFLPPENHRTGKDSVHLAPKKWLWLKELAEKTWCEYYGKTKEDFRKRYGRNYLQSIKNRFKNSQKLLTPNSFFVNEFVWLWV